jgi:transcriptional regulator with XRE-family HTH domain
MTGEQLRKLRESNGLSKRQFGIALGFSRTKPTATPTRKVTELERKAFIPETLVHRINKMVEDGRLTT